MCIYVCVNNTTFVILQDRGIEKCNKKIKYKKIKRVVLKPGLHKSWLKKVGGKKIIKIYICYVFSAVL